MRQFSLLTLVFGAFTIASGQILEREVISSGGNTIASSKVELSVTIGEPICKTHETTDLILSDGFEQQFDLFTLSVITIRKSKLSLYPNPTMGRLKISSDETIHSISIVNAMGQVVKKYTIESKNKELNMSDLPSGTYFIKVDQNTAQLTSKFIKI